PNCRTSCSGGSTWSRRQRRDWLSWAARRDKPRGSGGRRPEPEAPGSLWPSTDEATRYLIMWFFASTIRFLLLITPTFQATAATHPQLRRTVRLKRYYFTFMNCRMLR